MTVTDQEDEEDFDEEDELLKRRWRRGSATMLLVFLVGFLLGRDLSANSITDQPTVKNSREKANQLAQKRL